METAANNKSVNTNLKQLVITAIELLALNFGGYYYAR